MIRKPWIDDPFDAWSDGELEAMYRRVCFGKGGGGTNTVVQNSQPPQAVMDAYQNAISQAQSVASQPLQQYTGPMVAGFTPDQLSAMSTIDNSQGIATPYINAAAGLTAAGAAPINVPQFSGQALNQYMSPYTQDVVNATQAQFNNQNAQQQSALQGNAISKGAYGGDRAGVAAAQLAGQQQLTEAPTIAGLQQSGYQQALTEFNTQQQQQIAAQEASGWLAQNAGFGLGNLGNMAQSSTLAGANAQLQSGALQQQLAQENINVPYEQFVQQQAFPYQQTGWLAGVAEGLGSSAGGTSSTSYPGASVTGQVAGLGLTGLGAAGIANSAGWFNSAPSAPQLTGSGSGAGVSGFGPLGLGNAGSRRGGRIEPDPRMTRFMGGRTHAALGGMMSPTGSTSTTNIPDNPGLAAQSTISDAMGLGSALKMTGAFGPSGWMTSLGSSIGDMLGIGTGAMTDAEISNIAGGSMLGTDAAGLAGGAIAGAGTAAAIDAAAGGLGAAAGGEALADAGVVALALAKHGGRIEPHHYDSGGAISPPPLPSVPDESHTYIGAPPQAPAAHRGPPAPPGMQQPGTDPLQQGTQALDMAGAVSSMLKKPPAAPTDPTNTNSADGGRIHAAGGGAMPSSPMIAGYTPGPHGIAVPVLGGPHGGTPPPALTPPPSAGGGDQAYTPGTALPGHGMNFGGFQPPMIGSGSPNPASTSGPTLNITPTSFFSPPPPSTIASMGRAVPGTGFTPPPAPVAASAPEQPGWDPWNGGNPDFQSARGGRIHYDDGGSVMGAAQSMNGGMNSSSPMAPQQQQYMTLPLEKLQELSIRVPPSSPQGQMIRRALTTKKMQPTTPNPAMANPTGIAAPNLLNPTAGGAMSPPPSGGMAYGGRAHFDDGGDVLPDDVMINPDSGQSVGMPVPAPRQPLPHVSAWDETGAPISAAVHSLTSPSGASAHGHDVAPREINTPGVRPYGSAQPLEQNPVYKALAPFFTPSNGITHSKNYSAPDPRFAKSADQLPNYYGGAAPVAVTPGAMTPPPSEVPAAVDPVHPVAPDTQDAINAAGETAQRAGESAEQQTTAIPDDLPEMPQGKPTAAGRAPVQAPPISLTTPSAAPSAGTPSSSTAMTPYNASPLDMTDAGSQHSKPAPQPSAIASIAKSPWLPVVTAGLRMLASRSPNAGNAIGEGGLEGVKTALGQQAEEREEGKQAAEVKYKEGDLNVKSKQLSELAQFHRDSIARETARDQASAEHMSREDVLKQHEIDTNAGLKEELYGQGRYSYSAPTMGPDPDDPTKQVQGVYRLPLKGGDERPVFMPGVSGTGSAGAQTMGQRTTLADALGLQGDERAVFITRGTLPADKSRQLATASADREYQSNNANPTPEWSKMTQTQREGWKQQRVEQLTQTIGGGAARTAPAATTPAATDKTAPAAPAAYTADNPWRAPAAGDEKQIRADFARLPQGAVYINPADGKPYIKQ